MRISTKGSVALIGSFRQHYPEVLAAARTFAKAGLTVKSPPDCQIVNREDGFVRFASDPPESSNHDLQAATLAKIFTSDLVYVVNPGGYIGRTTAYELGRVHERGMAVYYAEPPKDLPIDVPEGTVVDARRLVEIIAGSDPGPAPVRRPRVAAQPTADIVIFTIRSEQLRVLLVRRGKKPYRGMLALPGGFVRPGESLEDTAKRELREETGLNGSGIRLEQLHTYSHPERDPRGRIISTAFLAVMPDPPEVTGASDAREADWVEVEESLWGPNSSLAFDHGEILRRGLEHLRTRLEHTTVATAFCDDLFTITDLRKVYEAVWGCELNAGNFYRKVVDETQGFVLKTGKVRRSGPGKPPALFRRGTADLLYPPYLRGRRIP
ncbi:NUDIX domain-containing protein [Streptomyces sp. NPDC049099]|uniref:NUDIX hydrolase n=1 Tax=Streptomyces sp. NPDC049099 TaxID=3155768 RepID=UPI003449F805